MIRLIRAMAWVRWRVLLHSLRGRGRGDGLQRFGRIAELLTPIIYALMAIPLCLGLSIGALVGGWRMASSGTSSEVVIVALRVLLGLVTGGVLLAPLVRSTQGSQLGVERLLLLPISRRALHLAEFFGGMTDPWILVVIPSLALLPAGLMLGGAPLAGLLVLLAGLLLTAALGALGSLCTHGLMLVFRDRRRAEWVTLVFIVAIVLAAFLPSYLGDSPLLPDHESAQPDFESYFGWAAGFPSELYARCVDAAARGESGAALAPMAILGALAVLLFALSGSFHRRLLQSPEQTSGRRSQEPALARHWTLPVASAAVSAVALAQVRTALRTVRGKIAVYFVVIVMILITMIFGRELLSGLPEGQAVEAGPLILLLGVLFTLVSLQPILMNQFAVDGAGLTLQFLTPASNRDLVRGKILGCAILAGISLLLCTAGAVAVSPGGSPWGWLAMVLVCVSAFALLAPACSLTSAYLPKRSNLNRLGRAGDPHGIAGLIGLALTVLALVPPVALYAAGIFLMESPTWALLMVGGWCVVTLGLALPASRLAEWAVARRRENLFLVATEGGS